MSLADALAVVPVAPQRPTKVGAYLDGLESADRDALLHALRGPGQTAWLCGVLAQHGLDVGETTLATYRRKLRQDGATA